jgi:hypothetical protein
MADVAFGISHLLHVLRVHLVVRRALPLTMKGA